jgi:S1-C subfamily serine protease
MSCATNQPSAERRSSEVAATYTTSFPTRDVSRGLSDVQQSIKRISSTGIYVTYYIDDRLVTEEELLTLDIEDLATRTLTSNESTAGTAISIFQNNNRAALLTNAHVVDFPDTLYSYIEADNVPTQTYVNAVKIKQAQSNLIFDLPNIGQFEINDYDERNDLALISVNRTEFQEIDASPLSISVGDPADLQWGSFLYILGFPKGYPMITRGIVSDPRRNEYDDFLTDALFNPGISGGLIMATRDNFNTFEWVGMTNTAAAEIEKRLVPDPSKVDQYQALDAYLDTAFVGVKTKINYGITQSIPMKKIIDFLEENEELLRRMGFRIGRYRIP